MTDKTTEAFDAWWADEGEQSLYALNTTTDDDIKILAGIAWEAAIREALAESKPAPDGRIPKTVFTIEDIGKAAEMGRQAGMIDALAKQEPTSNKYNHKRVGWELERTAKGDSYYGNALYSAMDLHFLNKREKDCLHRYMHGSETPNDRFVLQDIANKVYFEPEAEQEKQEPVYAFRRRGLDDFCTCTKERYDELVDKPNLFEVTTFYAAPVSAKREWVELTDYEIVRMYAESPMCDSEMIAFARAVITAFKEKNK